MTEIASDSVIITPRNGTGAGTQIRHFCARLDGCLDKRFKVISTKRSEWQAPHELERHRLVYTYSLDSDDWREFDSVVGEGDTFEALNFDPFTADTIYVSNIPSYTGGRYDALVDAWIADANTLPTESAASGYELGDISETLAAPNGKDLPAMVCRALRVGTGPVKVAMTSGVHPDEIGDWIFEGAVNKVLADDQEGADLRGAFTFYVYPNLNPQGLYGGYCRVNPENDADANRAWADVADTKITGLYRPAWQVDAGATGFAAMFDFHSSPGTNPAGRPGRDLWLDNDVPAETALQPFLTALGDYGDFAVGNSDFSTNQSVNGHFRTEWSPKLVITVEYTHSSAEFIPDWKAFGADIMRALLDIANEF